jgi:hypothetical protein
MRGLGCPFGSARDRVSTGRFRQRARFSTCTKSRSLPVQPRSRPSHTSTRLIYTCPAHKDFPSLPIVAESGSSNVCRTTIRCYILTAYAPQRGLQQLKQFAIRTYILFVKHLLVLHARRMLSAWPKNLHLEFVATPNIPTLDIQASMHDAEAAVLRIDGTDSNMSSPCKTSGSIQGNHSHQVSPYFLLDRWAFRLNLIVLADPFRIRRVSRWFRPLLLRCGRA